MKTRLRSLLALLALAPAALFATEKSTDAKSQNCGCRCCKGKEVCCCNEDKPSTTDSPAQPDSAPRHPLKGVIVEVQADQSALLVKHENIPGFMPPMTMLFKVDAATLKAAAKGQAISGTLVQRDDGFWLEDVKPAR